MHSHSVYYYYYLPQIYVGPLYQLAANVYVANSSIRFIVEPWYL